MDIYINQQTDKVDRPRQGKTTTQTYPTSNFQKKSQKLTSSSPLKGIDPLPPAMENPSPFSSRVKVVAIVSP